MGKNLQPKWLYFGTVGLALGIIVFTGLPGARTHGAHAQTEPATLICDEPANIRASRTGASGRAYPCYTLERATNLRFGRSTLHCDEEGPTYAARSGRSGRYHACYALGQIAEFQYRGATIACDIDHGRDATRLGLSGRRYDCYALSPVPDSAR